MNFRKPRVGAFAPAALLFVTLFGAATSGALAQKRGPEAPAAAVALPADAPRFVAEAVVQPLPEEEAREERVRQATSLHALVGDMPVEAELSADMRCLAQAV